MSNTTSTTTNLSLVRELREKTAISMAQCIKALNETGDNIDEAILWLKKNGTLKGQESSGREALEGVVLADINREHNTAACVEINCETDFCSRNSEFIAFTKSFMLRILSAPDVSAEFSREVDAERMDVVAKTGESVVIRRESRLSGDETTYFAAYNHPGNRLCALVQFQLSRAVSIHDADFQAFAEDIAMQVAANAPKFVSTVEIPAFMTDTQAGILKAQLRAENKPEASWDRILPGKIAKWQSEITLMSQPMLKDPKITVDSAMTTLAKKLGSDVKIVGFVRYALGETTPVLSKRDLASDVASMIEGDKQ
jgi:elongation factor Ts